MTVSPLLPAAPCTANPVVGWQVRWAQIAATFAQAMLAKHRQVRLTARNTYLNLLTNFPCCHWSYGEGFWHGRIPPRRQLCCESLRLAFSFAVCSLPFLATFPVSAPFCMPQRGTTGVYSNINSSAGNLPGCLQFHYNLLSPDSWGCLGIGSTVDSWSGAACYTTIFWCTWSTRHACAQMHWALHIECILPL